MSFVIARMELQGAVAFDDEVVVLAGKKETAGSAATVSPDSSSSPNMIASTANKSPAAPSSSAPSKSNSIPDAIQEVLNISFPRCSVCKTGWYDSNANEGSNADCSAGGIKRKRHCDRPSHLNLFPMPQCGCTTRLALPQLPHTVFSSEECKDPLNVLSHVTTHSFPNLAICKSCLPKRIAASKEVTEHDYRMSHVENGQRNVKFTVEPDCVQCKRKFMGRVLEKLLESEGGPKINDSGGRGKKRGKSDANWWDAVEATIQLVGWAKRDQRRERKKMRQHKRGGKMNLEAGRNQQKNSCYWKNHDGFTGGDGSSDECYSLSSDSDDEWQSDDDSPRTRGPHRVEVKSGELEEELMQKDPKFKQEVEDRRWLEQLAREEEDKKRAAEARDLELAMKLDEEFNPKATTRSKSKSPFPSGVKRVSSGSAKKFSSKQPSARKQGKLSWGGASGAASSKSSIRKTTGPEDKKSSLPAASTPKHADETIDDEAVNTMVAMGFSKASAQRCLKDANGDFDLAVSMILKAASERDSR